MQRVQKGFTLIEIMISVAIVGILMAVAIPAYSDYVIRGRLSEAFTALGGAQPAAEQFWSNNRTYFGFGTASSFPPNTANFTYGLGGATASSYTITATGVGKMAGFVYTIDQSGTRTTTGSPPGWGVSGSCWVDHKGGACSN
ncbi:MULTISPECIES: type IV pilin protein [unclassified Duganella]|uniref:type IV pilin protein n=1 Tax=unclassified Duganella TaxID=2636909 RepID=UPI000E34E921|nr:MULTISPECIES: type IV pilin protein [unclassified Duganella]RFP19031.1 prepilin-type N-terminal cleavage/methylation domain-containing protein [Duganella sp. BJB475]RFP35693.1 prepilin-type N-terminal cleavage/methylation domain-containing protein [Duganella sp. BJB476]